MKKDNLSTILYELLFNDFQFTILRLLVSFYLVSILKALGQTAYNYLLLVPWAELSPQDSADDVAVADDAVVADDVAVADVGFAVAAAIAVS